MDPANPPAPTDPSTPSTPPGPPDPPAFDEWVRGIVRKISIPAKGVAIISKIAKGVFDFILAFGPVSGGSLKALSKVVVPVLGFVFDACNLTDSACNISSDQRLYTDLTNVVNASADQRGVLALRLINKIDELDNADVLNKIFNISAAGKRVLKNKIGEARGRVNALTGDDLAFFRTLAELVDRQIGIEKDSAKINGGSIAVGLLGAVPVPWVQVISAVGYTTCAVLSLALWIFNDLCTNQNPFDPSSCSVFQSGYRYLSARVNHLFDQVRGLFPVHVLAPATV